ncbi:MAG: dUTP diphosphatase [Dehalococcoidia bacterium]|nr:dUTP diphosphatase [Dehalococcoidia bacterium]
MTLAADRQTGAEALEARFLRLRPGARIPALQTPLASGHDLHASLDAPVQVGTMPVRIPCGFAMAVPEGTDVQIRPRSGLSAKGVMAVLGTLDADYRGELMVTLYCLPEAAPFEVRDGDRIAQLVVSRLVPVAWREVETLDETERGSGGHGSTGLR